MKYSLLFFISFLLRGQSLIPERVTGLHGSVNGDTSIKKYTSEYVNKISKKILSPTTFHEYAELIQKNYVPYKLTPTLFYIPAVPK
jgi:hypothetical protein